MKIHVFMIFQFFGIISAWASKALADGKVTAAEGLELVVSLAGILGVVPEFDVSDYIDQPKTRETIISESLGSGSETEPAPPKKPEE